MMIARIGILPSKKERQALAGKAVILVLIGVFGATLFIANLRNGLIASSRTVDIRSAEIALKPTVAAGIEEALAHIANSRDGGNLWSDGWRRDDEALDLGGESYGGPWVVVGRCLDRDAAYKVSISLGASRFVAVEGFARISGTEQYAFKRVLLLVDSVLDPVSGQGGERLRGGLQVLQTWNGVVGAGDLQGDDAIPNPELC